MSKRYEYLKRLLPLPGGGFRAAFEVGIVEMTCLGEQRYTADGYPYESEGDALARDWEVLAQDAETAINKFHEQISSDPTVVDGSERAHRANLAGFKPTK